MDMRLANRFEQAINDAGIATPQGVCIVDPNDRATWVVHDMNPADAATVQAVIDNFDPANYPDPVFIKASTILGRMTRTEQIAFDAFIRTADVSDPDSLAALTLEAVNGMRVRIDPYQIPSAEATAALGVFKAAGLAIGVWADDAAADARIAQLLAP